MKKFIAIILTFSMLYTMLPVHMVMADEGDFQLMAETQVFEGGDGSVENPYLISNEEQLRLIQDFPTCSFELINNIELKNQWSIIGSAGDNFSGTLDGNYYTISGLTNRFMEINDGVVKNIKFMNNYSSVSSVAFQNNGTIENCKALGDVNRYYQYRPNSFFSIYHRCAAGFVFKNNGTIKNCAFEGKVRLSTEDETVHVGQGYDTYRHYSAGFVSLNYGKIENSYVIAEVTGTAAIGFVHETYTDTNIKNCYSITKLISNYSNNKSGFFYEDEHNGTITNSYYDKDVAGINDTTSGTPKATLAMKMKSTYSEWDFENVWDIDENINDGYPYLKMEQNFLPKVESIVFDENEIYLEPSNTKLMGVEITPNDTGRKLSWSSSDEQVAMVDENGLITAVGEGDADIILSAGEFSNSLKVHVVDDLINIEDVSLDRNILNLNRGEEYTLTAALEPANATDKRLIWTSTNEKIATVDDNGCVTAVSDGSATITVTTKDNNCIDECVVNVKTPVTDVKLSSSNLNLNVGKVFTLTAEIQPSNATNKELIWKSSSEDVATVVDGIVTAKSAGNTVITVISEDGGIFDQCDVTVTVPVDGISLNKTMETLSLGSSVELIATINPSNASNQKILWSTSNDKVVTVENGIVKAIGTGFATVTAMTEDGEKKVVCQITVPVSVTGVTVSENELVIDRGRTKKLYATVTPSDATNKNIIWTSSNSEIATVDNGVVTGVSSGTAVITATTEDGNKIAQCVVTVNVPVEGITLNHSNISLPIENTIELIPTITPFDATNQEILWSTSNSSIATVKDGIVTAVGRGDATITVTTQDGNFKATCFIKVPVEITGITLNKVNIKLNKGDKSVLKATIEPSDATNKNVIWTSSNNAVATVKDGIVTAVGTGSAVITVFTEDKVFSANCNVDVNVNTDGIVLDKSNLTINVNDTADIIATVLPVESTDKTVIWTSSDEDIAVVNNNGKVTALKTGTTIITATASNGSTAECIVNVVVPVDGITLDQSSLKLDAGDKRTLIPTVTPSNATNKNVIWTSSDDKVATVDNGVITAISEGSAVIIAKTVDGNKVASCNVSVVVPATQIVLNKTVSVLAQGEKDVLEAEVLPITATNKSVLWKSSNPDIVSVDNGTITALNPGSSIITAICGNVTATCVVNVNVKYSTEMTVGSTRDCAGSTVTIPITITKNPGIATFNIGIKFDSDKLTPISIEKGSILQDKGTLTSNLQSENFTGDIVTAYWVNPSNFEEDGEILLITFLIKEGAEDGEIPIEITHVLGDITNQGFETVALNSFNGCISVETVMVGDVFEDGTVDVKDGLKLNQYIAQWEVDMNKFELMAADIHKDGDINSKDGLKLSQYLAKWDIELMALAETNNNIKFEVGNVSGRAGEYVDVPIKITENSGVAAYNLKVSYDDSLVPVSITNNLSNGTLTSNLQQENFNSDYVTAYWVNPSNNKTIGNAFTIRFKINEDVDGELPITLSYEEGDICDQLFNNLNTTLTHGFILINNSDYDYSIDDINISDIEGGYAYANANIRELSINDTGNILLIAVYDKEGLLVDLKTIDITTSNDRVITINEKIIYEEGHEIKAFIWDNLNDMNALSKVCSL